ncbi:MAG: Ig-like domain-containing protein [Gemmatimonadota bacterium]
MRRHEWLLVILAAGCGTDTLAPGEPVPVSRVAILPAANDLLKDDTLQLVAIGLSVGGDTLRGRQVTWSSSDPSVISVSAGGAATALAPGSATILATIEGKQKSLALQALALSFTSISTGNNHTCAVAADGRAWCWGANDFGQLGLAVTSQLSNRTPRSVAGGLLFESIAAGSDATCGLLRSGASHCWGSNQFGQLGDGSTTDRNVPTPVSGSLIFAAISAPLYHTCGILLAGGQRCWGTNTSGQLGDGSYTDRVTPVAVLGGHVFSQIFPSLHGFSCGIDTGDAAWCWGDDYEGYLGHDTTYFSTSPSPVAGGLNFTQIGARSRRSCGLTVGGQVWCWGLTYFGQVMVVPSPGPATPALVSLSKGEYHTCGLTASGEAWCWGLNSEGQLGNGAIGENEIEYPPAPVSGGVTFVSLSAGDLTTCGLDTSGSAWCWGANRFGALGVGDSLHFNVLTPAPVTGNLTFTAISTAGYHTCGITGSGSAYCWGSGPDGELGDGGPSTLQRSPTAVAGNLTFQSIVAHSSQTCGIANGAAYCWGANYAGQLGDGTLSSHPMPTAVRGGLTLARLAGGLLRTCGLDPLGAAYCWGDNRHGALGDGTETQSLVPVAVTGGHTFTEITIGQEHVCAVTSQGVGYCWGDNLFGQLGNGVRTDSPIPVTAAAGLAFVSIGTAGGRSCGITAVGDAYCWPSAYQQPDPSLVPGGVHFSQLSVGFDHVCGLTSGGVAYCWGQNFSGQLGNGNIQFNDQLIPAPVAGGLTFSSISSGSGHSCGIATDGVAYCWGSNWSGELGVSGFEDAGGIPYPVKVRGQP